MTTTPRRLCRLAATAALVLLALPGRAAASEECLVRFVVPGATGDPEKPVLVCRDGDPACDLDGVDDGVCTVPVVVCTGMAPCAETAGRLELRARDGGALAARVSALAAEPPPACTAPTPYAVERGARARRKRTLRVRATGAGGRTRDRDRLRLVCEGPRPPRAVIVTSDFETGRLVTGPVAQPRRLHPVATPVHADAVVRVAGDTAFVVNRYLGDNVQVLNDRLRTRLQCSTGVGSNPHDLVLVAPDKAYVTRYDREALWIVDPGAASCQSFHTGSIDLGALADGDGLPEMSQMAVVGTRLFVTLQRLDRRAGFTATGSSLLAVIDTMTDTLAGTVELVGRNAFDDAAGIQREPGSGKLLVSQAGDVYRTGDGGIERVDPEAMVSEGWVVTETALGGTITDFVVVSPSKGYAIVLDEALRNLLVAFDPRDGSFRGRVFASSQLLSDLALAPDGTLWLADRALPRPGVRIFDVATDAPVRPLVDVGLPPFAMGFLP